MCSLFVTICTYINNPVALLFIRTCQMSIAHVIAVDSLRSSWPGRKSLIKRGRIVKKFHRRVNPYHERVNACELKPQETLNAEWRLIKYFNPVGALLSGERNSTCLRYWKGREKLRIAQGDVGEYWIVGPHRDYIELPLSVFWISSGIQ